MTAPLSWSFPPRESVKAYLFLFVIWVLFVVVQASVIHWVPPPKSMPFLVRSEVEVNCNDCQQAHFWLIFGIHTGFKKYKKFTLISNSNPNHMVNPTADHCVPRIPVHLVHLNILYICMHECFIYFIRHKCIECLDQESY